MVLGSIYLLQENQRLLNLIYWYVSTLRLEEKIVIAYRAKTLFLLLGQKILSTDKPFKEAFKLYRILRN